jgi:hypothetical protein
MNREVYAHLTVEESRSIYYAAGFKQDELSFDQYLKFATALALAMDIKQAELDRIMLEYCPHEMTDDQM